MDEHKEISINDYAELKNISPYTVRSLIKKGHLKATKYGRIWRINIAAVPVEPEEKYPRVFKSKEDFCAMLDAI